jgi:hypothetical protein
MDASKPKRLRRGKQTDPTQGLDDTNIGPLRLIGVTALTIVFQQVSWSNPDERKGAGRQVRQGAGRGRTSIHLFAATDKTYTDNIVIWRIYR